MLEADRNVDVLTPDEARRAVAEYRVMRELRRFSPAFCEGLAERLAAEIPLPRLDQHGPCRLRLTL